MVGTVNELEDEYPKQTTYKDFWLFIALMVLIAMSHEHEYQDEVKQIQNKYWYGE